MESPESWFEDFGEAQLRNGRIIVRIPKDFAPFIRTNRYHVFVTPYGKCGGLAVTSRNAKQFEVSELNSGKSNVRFSYRIVAERADIAGKRLEKVQIEPLATPESVTTNRMVAPTRNLRGMPRGEAGPRPASFTPPKERRS